MMARLMVATLATAALVAGLAMPADIAYAAPTSADGDDIRITNQPAVPAFEPQTGRGTPLLAGVAQDVALGPRATSAHSALIRVSVFEATGATRLDAAGTTALSVAAGHSASTTLIVPVTSGTVQIESNTPADVRVETLALFSAPSSVPGATIALREPVSRADSAAGVGLSRVGLVGLGGVPSEHVRAVYVTVNVSAVAASTLVLDDQSFSISAGRTSISTIVTPSEAGDVAIETTGPIDYTVVVRGYVAEASAYPDALNGPGSYWPNDAAAPTVYDLSDTTNTAVTVPPVGADGFALALITAEGAGTLTTVGTDGATAGRATGILVDPLSGAQAQLALIPLNAPQLTVRRGSTAVSVLPLGTLLGSDGGSGSAPSITLDSPITSDIDARATRTFEFAGTISTPGSSPLRVDVQLDGEDYATATLRATDEGVGWSFDASVPDSGDYRFDFTIVERSGGTSRVSWEGSVTNPGPSDIVVSSRAIVLGSAGHEAAIHAVAPDWVEFSTDPGLQPGDIIAGDVEPNAPEGIFRTIVSIDAIGGIWRVTTVPALLDEAFLQLRLDEAVALGPEDLIGIEEIAAEPDPGSAIIESSVEVVTAPEVDVEPYLGESSTPGGVDTPGVDFQRSGDSLGSSARAALASAIELPSPLVFTTSFTSRTSLTVGGSPSTGGAAVSVEAGTSTDLVTTASLNLVVDIRMEDRPFDVPPFIVTVPEFSMWVSVVSKGSHTSDFSVSGGWTHTVPAPTYILYFAPITVFAGPLPLVFVDYISLKPKLTISISGQLDVTLGFSMQSTTKRGVRFVYGVPTPIHEGPTITSPPMTVSGSTFTVKAEVAAGLELAFNMLLAGVAGPSLFMSAMLGTSAALAQDLGDDPAPPMVTVSRFLEFSTGIRFKITLFGFVDIVDATLGQLSKRFTLGVDVLDLWSFLGTTNPDGPSPGEPETEQPPSCNAGVIGTAVTVCNPAQFRIAAGSASVRTIILGQDIGTCTLQSGDDDECVGVPVARTAMSGTKIIDVLGHSLVVLGLDLPTGGRLTIKNSTFGEGGVYSTSTPGSDRAGIALNHGELRVESGSVSGVGDGRGAGIGGDELVAGGRVTVLGGRAAGIGGSGSSQNGDGAAGIGGGYRGSGGTVYVYGGSAYGGGADGGAGIGGGAFASGGSLTVTGGEASGTGGENAAPGLSLGGAGIGGGSFASAGSILVAGGSVAGFGKNGGAGIGGGAFGYGGTLRVTGGEVRGFGSAGGSGGAGIGGGNGASGGLILISDGVVSGFAQDGAGAGIGGGAGARGGTSTISGGTVRVFSGDFGGAALGGGAGGDSGSITITDATVDAFGYGGGAGIGGGVGGSSTPFTVTDSTISAFGDGGGAAVGSGAGGDAGSISILGGTLRAFGGSGSAGIGGGTGGDSGVISIEGAIIGSFTDGGAAAIGGGIDGDSGGISITSSTVEAISYGVAPGGGSAIGSAQNGSIPNITISSSTVTARANNGAAAIGSGSGGSVGPIEISDAVATLSVDNSVDGGVDGGAGVGSGANGSAGDVSISSTTIDISSVGGGAAIGSGARGTAGAITISEVTSQYISAHLGGAALGSGRYGSVGDIVIDASTLSANAGTGGAGIGSGFGGTAGAITVGATTIPIAFGGGGAAGIGGGTGGISGSIDITGSTVTAYADQGGAGIGGGNGLAGPGVDIRDSTVSAFVGPAGFDGSGAGIGGGALGDGGTITLTGVLLSSTPFEGGAAIGGGTSGNGGVITLTNVTGDQIVAGTGAAAVGGGIGGAGGSVVINGGSLTLTGSAGALVEGAGTEDPESVEPGFAGAGAILGGGAGGDGADVEIMVGSTVTLRSAGEHSAIGAGIDGISFGSLDMAGTLQLDAATLVLPAGTEVTVTGAITGVPATDGTIESAAFIDGQGTLNNQGLVTATIAETVIYVGPTYTVTFEPNHLDSVDAVTTVTSYADTFLIGRRALPVPTPIDGWTFLGWNTAADGTGAEVTVDTALSGPLTAYAIWEVV